MIADAGVTLVALVEIDDHGRQPLERARARQRPGVERTAGDDLRRQLQRERLRRRRRRRRRTRPRRAGRARACPQRASEARRPPAPRSRSCVRSRERARLGGMTPLGEAQLAGDAEHGRHADRFRERRSRSRAPHPPSSRARRGRRRGPHPRSSRRRLRRPRAPSPAPARRRASRSRPGRPPLTSRRASARPKSPVPPTIATLMPAPLPARPRRGAGARRRRSSACGSRSAERRRARRGRRRRPRRPRARRSAPGNDPQHARGDVPPARRCSIRSAGPFTARPPMSGLTATQGHVPPRERVANLAHREDRGERDVRVARREQDQIRARDRVEHARRRPRRLFPLEAEGIDLVAVAAGDEPFLERERPGRRLEPRPEPVVGRRQQPCGDTELPPRAARSRPRAARPPATPASARDGARGRDRRARTSSRRPARRPSRAHARSRPLRPQPRRSSARPASA